MAPSPLAESCFGAPLTTPPDGGTSAVRAQNVATPGQP
jgi:hypothetical protein